jgi:hypothetical protein
MVSRPSAQSFHTSCSSTDRGWPADLLKWPAGHGELSGYSVIQYCRKYYWNSVYDCTRT